MSVQSEKLASAIFMKEPIWNPKHAQHKNRIIIQQCWTDLSLEMNIDGMYYIIHLDSSLLKLKLDMNYIYIRLELRRNTILYNIKYTYYYVINVTQNSL